MVALLLLGTLAAGCGGSDTQADTSKTPGASSDTGSTSGASTGVSTAPSTATSGRPIPNDGPSASVSLTPNPTASTSPFVYDGPINRDGSVPVTADAVNSTYDTFIGNLSGLFTDLDPVYATAMREVATQRMTAAIVRAAKAIQDSQSHVLGTLTDTKRTLTVKGKTARIISCLDEQTWYVVKNGTNKQDPGITRGYFVGRATFTYANGRWFVDTWNSLPQPCKR